MKRAVFFEYPNLLEVQPRENLLRMGNDVNEMVCIARNYKVKAPTTVDANLPDTKSFVILFCMEGGVMKITY